MTGFRDLTRARPMLCTGMSRARAVLVVVSPRDQIEGSGGEAVRRRLRDAVDWPLEGGATPG